MSLLVDNIVFFALYLSINRSIELLCSLERESTVLQEREKAEKQEQAVLTTSQHVTQPPSQKQCDNLSQTFPSTMMSLKRKID
jgi:hypothetical protein